MQCTEENVTNPIILDLSLPWISLPNFMIFLELFPRGQEHLIQSTNFMSYLITEGLTSSDSHLGVTHKGLRGGSWEHFGRFLIHE